jgi:formate dehydrogenase major subunit
VPGLGTSFGRGGATAAPSDLLNSDAILIMGSNMAENHPVGFQWVIDARERGTHVIHVDPRFSRTSAMSTMWAPIRAGSDLLFLGGLINYVLERGLEFREYVVPYTNASAILPDDVRDAEDLGGLFSGWDPQEGRYQSDAWLFQRNSTAGTEPPPDCAHVSGGHAKDSGRAAADVIDYDRDPTLEHPRCVFQLLKRHFARYTPEMVERFCGVPKERFLEIAEIYCSASGPEKTGAICYAVGWTQHSTGAQIIRSAAILQLLLGNIGRPGGGILALRGHASIQGSTDIPTLFDVLPGYLAMPRFGPDASLDAYVTSHRDRTGWWSNYDKYIVSLLKAYYGDAATKENGFGFGWLPRVTGDHSHQGYWMDMMDGKVEGLFVMGQNPAVAAPNARLERTALAKLKWLVVRDMVEVETASFWYDSAEVERGELRTEEIGTEVFLMPAAGHTEKEGCFTNTQRLLQWHQKAVDPPGDARSESWFMYHLGTRLKDKAKRDPRPRNAGLNALTWDYSVTGDQREPRVEEVLQEINGYTVAAPGTPRPDRAPVAGFGELKADGSTASGCWIYSGVFPRPGVNHADERQAHDAYGHGWGFAWPADRRVLYNRASARPDGRPWSERKKLVWWDAAAHEWTGLDVPDFTKTKAPGYQAPRGAEGDAALSGDKPFILHTDGVGWIWAPTGLADGPLPTHYEPLESPVSNPLYPAHQINPGAMKLERPDNQYARLADPRFPIVMTTYRLTEHHTAGGMSRTLPHLAELQPEFFCELSPELAAERGIEPGGWLTIMNMRGIVEARALVTSRMRPLRIDGQTVHQIGVPYHWGTRGLVTGDSANDLLMMSEEPNVRIMEAKGLLCDVVPGRRARGAAALEQWRAHMRNGS